MIDVCSWDAPNSDRYSGLVSAAIAAYGLPIQTQSALIAAFERREFTDSVVIDRDTIRGKSYEYAPDIRAMHFGSRGRICGTVTRAGWSAEHVETALVVCALGECIAWPAVCGNVFRLTRRAGADRPEFAPLGVPAAALVDAFDAPQPLIADPQTTNGAFEPRSEMESLNGAWSVGPAFNTFTDASYAYGGASFPGLPRHVAAVAEPSTYALFLAGLAAVALVKRRRA